MPMTYVIQVNVAQGYQKDIAAILESVKKTGGSISKFVCEAILEKAGKKQDESTERVDGVVNTLYRTFQKMEGVNLSYFIPKELDSGKTTVEKVAKVFTMIRSTEVQMRNTAMIMEAVRESNVYIDSKRQATSSHRLEKFASKIANGIRNGLSKLDKPTIQNQKVCLGIDEWKRRHPTLPYACRYMSEKDLYDLEHPTEEMIVE